ncbi:D-2-hydroxyacid dehydrogenase [Bacillaceae bacterium Marseille-Q3522]|nr:D-2-hydroxyacid dehydrogenase [Bacillaceae bacterium Marseille-Q3522]
MSTQAVEIPLIYVRTKLPDFYLQQLKKLSAKVIVEPWEYGKPEPETHFNLNDCEVLLTLGIQDPLHILEKVPNVKWIHSTSVGTEAMLLNKEIRNSDIVITNAKGCTSVPIAEHTVAMISSLARGLPAMMKNQALRKWERIPVTDLTSSTVGIIGYGEIGYEIAKRCKALDMRVIGCKRNPHSGVKINDPADKIAGMDQVDEVIAEADFLVLSLPATNETYHFMNRERLGKMKKGSFLINVGRGNTVMESALVENLRNNHLGGAALDVFEVEPLPTYHPLWELDNVIISPHNAFFSPKHSERIMDLFLENVKRFSAGKPLLNVIDKEKGY